MVDQPGALWVPNNNCFTNRDGLRPRYVIIHGTAGGSSAQNIASYFKSTEGTSNPVSATYVVGQDGVVVQCNAEKDGAYANGVISNGHDAWWTSAVNPNDITISIECVKPDVNNASALTSAQFNALVKLVKDICQRQGIPTRAADALGGITGHFSIDPVNRSACPGTFDWNAFWSALNQTQEEVEVSIELSTPGVSPYFGPAANGKWICTKNGMHLGGANLSFYKRFGGDGLCGLTHLGLPLTEEINPNISGHPEIRLQPCERGCMAYDPHHILDAPPGSGEVYILKFTADPRYTQIQGKLVAVENAYNAVNTEKNEKIGEINQLTAELKQAQTSGNAAQYTALQNTIATYKTEATALLAKL